MSDTTSSNNDSEDEVLLGVMGPPADVCDSDCCQCSCYNPTDIEQ